MKTTFKYLIGTHQVIGDKFQINEHYRPIAEKLVEKFDELKNVPVKNILFVDNVEQKKSHKGKLVFAEISKIPNKWQEIILQTTGFYFEYMLTVYRENTDAMSQAQKVAMIYHELRHIQNDDLVGHDIEDWNEMHLKLGHNWATTMADIPNLLSDTVDWDKIDGPAVLFTQDGNPNDRILKAVK